MNSLIIVKVVILLMLVVPAIITYRDYDRITFEGYMDNLFLTIGVVVIGIAVCALVYFLFFFWG